MFLPKTQEYAVRCMAQISLLPNSTTINAEKLSQLVNVPKDYLSKVLQKLTASGLLLGEKGHGGGFKLSKDASEITFLEILHATGYSLDPEHCISGWGKCKSYDPCPLHETFSRLNKAVYSWAVNTTLNEIDKTRPSLVNND
jgi:Rrf2 family iron-sulfur cluster assembly transcriptional regulator